MRRFLMTIIVFCALPAAAQPVVSRIDAVPRIVDLGAVSPRCTGCSPSTLTFRVRSDSPWQLLIRERDESGAGPKFRPAAPEELRFRPSESEWQTATAGGAVLVASGPATPEKDVFVAVDVMALCLFDAPAGPRRFTAQCTLLPSGATEDVEIRYTVPPSFEIELVSEQTLPNLNASVIGIQPFLQRRVVVRANTAWTLELTIARPFVGRDSRNVIADDSLYVSAPGRSERARAALGIPLAITSGRASGEQGEVVDVQLMVSTERLVVADTYTGEIATVAREHRPADPAIRTAQ